jgi:uncharacterized membrane protein
LLPLISPLYWLLGWLLGTYTLLFIQWLLIMTGGWATYLFIKRKGAENFTACAALVLYLVVHGRFTAYRADCNLTIMGSALVPLLLLFFDSGKWKWFTIVLAVLLLTREDFSLWLFFIGVFLAIAYRRDRTRRNAALVTSGVAVVFFALVFTVIIPYFLEDENKKYSLFDYRAVGHSPGEALWFLVTHPMKGLELLFMNHLGASYYEGVKSHFYWVYLLSGGAVLILRPLYLVPLLPLLAKKMYNDNPLRWSVETYYSVEFATVLPMLVFWVISEMKSMPGRKLIGVLTCTGAMAATVQQQFAEQERPLIGESNKHNFLRPGFYKPDFDPETTNRLLALIPNDASVSAGQRIVPHLAFRKKIFYFPRADDAQYIVVFRHNDAYPLSPDDFDRKIGEVRNSSEWELMEETSQAWLFRRVHAKSD